VTSGEVTRNFDYDGAGNIIERNPSQITLGVRDRFC
jgi:YD repeat-containing protein